MSILSSGAREHNLKDREEVGGTFEIFAGPSLERIVGVLFSQRGLLIATPVIALAVVGIVIMWRRGWRVDAVVVTLAFLSMLSIQFMWGNSFAGGAGPRYVTPGLPFLAAPLTVAWRRWRLSTTALAILGVATLVAATVTVPQLGSGMGAGMADWLRTLAAGRVAPTIYTEAMGTWGWLLHLATVGLALGWLLISSSDPKCDERIAPLWTGHRRLANAFKRKFSLRIKECCLL